MNSSGAPAKVFSMAALAVAVVMALGAPAVYAAPAEKPLQAAGPPPSDAAANAAILKYLRSASNSVDRRKFKGLSGPTLVTANTFGGSIEQAWLMCLVVNAEKRAPGPQELVGRAVYLRSQAGQVVVAPTSGWKDSSPHCGGTTS